MQANYGFAALLVAALSMLSACASQQTDTPRSPSMRAAPQSAAAKTAAADAATVPARVRALAAKAAPNDPAEQERLVEAFMQWRKSQQKR